MRSTALMLGLFTVALGAQAQQVTPDATPAPAPRSSNYRFVRSDDMGDRAVLGINTSGGGKRDTLGLLITSVTPNGPAEKAGLTEGDRIVSVNGTSLKVSAADAGEPEMNGIMSRRLVRTMSDLKAGDEVTLVVYSNGSSKTVKVKTIAMDDLNEGSMKKKSSDRAAVGLGFGGGSVRDTLGLFVESVTAGGPADKAGIQEGMRIAAINGVDMRVPAADAADAEDGSLVWAKQGRFTRTLSALTPGDVVELKVWTDGSYKTFKVTTVKSSDLYGKNSNAWSKYAEDMANMSRRVNVAIAPMPPMPPMAPMAPMAPMRMKYDYAPGSTMTCNTIGDGTVICRSSGGNGKATARARANSGYGYGSSSAPSIQSDDNSDSDINFPGLRMTTVTDELASYFGAGSENGLLVLEASDEWSPVKTGDVVLTLNGRAVVKNKTTSVSLDTGRDNTFVVLRKGKKTTVVVKAH